MRSDQPGQVCGHVLHQHKHTFDGFTDSGNLQLPGGNGLVPSEALSQEVQHVALVVGIGVLQMAALGFHDDDAPRGRVAACGKDEVGIDAPAFPALQPVVGLRRVAEPPLDRCFAVKANGNILFFAVQLIPQDRRKKAAFQRATMRTWQVRRVGRLGRRDMIRHLPVVAVQPKAELDVPGLHVIAEQGFRATVPLLEKRQPQRIDDDAGCHRWCSRPFPPGARLPQPPESYWPPSWSGRRS